MGFGGHGYGVVGFGGLGTPWKCQTSITENVCERKLIARKYGKCEWNVGMFILNYWG